MFSSLYTAYIQTINTPKRLFSMASVKFNPRIELLILRILGYVITGPYPYADRLIRTIKEEEVYLSDYRDFADAYAQIGQFIEQVYQHKRIHSALGYLAPAEFEANWKQQQQHQQPPPLSNISSLIVG